MFCTYKWLDLGKTHKVMISRPEKYQHHDFCATVTNRSTCSRGIESFVVFRGNRRWRTPERHSGAWKSNGFLEDCSLLWNLLPKIRLALIKKLKCRAISTLALQLRPKFLGNESRFNPIAGNLTKLVYRFLSVVWNWFMRSGCRRHVISHLIYVPICWEGCWEEEKVAKILKEFG